MRAGRWNRFWHMTAKIQFIMSSENKALPPNRKTMYYILVAAIAITIVAQLVVKILEQ